MIPALIGGLPVSLVEGNARSEQRYFKRLAAVCNSVIDSCGFIKAETDLLSAKARCGYAGC